MVFPGASKNLGLTNIFEFIITWMLVLVLLTQLEFMVSFRPQIKSKFLAQMHL